MTPPVSPIRSISGSERLRLTLVSARTFEWLAITGAADRSITCKAAWLDSWEISTMPPRALIFTTAAFPKADKPPCSASGSRVPVSPSNSVRDESAKSLWPMCVRAKTLTPTSYKRSIPVTSVPKINAFWKPRISADLPSAWAAVSSSVLFVIVALLSGFAARAVTAASLVCAKALAAA